MNGVYEEAGGKFVWGVSGASCWNGLLALHGDWDVDACWKVAKLTI